MTRLIMAIALAAALALPGLAGDYVVGVGLSLWLWVALAQSWLVISGLAGYLSLGHVVFYGLGAYVAVLVWGSVGPWPGVALAGLAAGLFALVVSVPVLRVRGPYFVMLTYGLAELVKYAVVNLEAAQGSFGRLLLGAPALTELYFAMLGLALCASAAVVWIGRGRFGAGLRAIREDEDAAETLGVPVVRLKAAAFVLSAVVPGMAGALMAMRSGYFEPLQLFSPVVSFTVVTIAVIGGGDDARGPLYGAALLVLLSELLWSSLPELYMILLGLLLLAFVLFLPGGLAGLRRPAA